MNLCPECGNTVQDPYKTWPVKSKKSGSNESKTHIGMFDCPECGNRFRAGVRETLNEGLNINGMSQKIKGIEVEFVNTLKNLREKLKTLGTERSNLLLEIGELKKMAEAKASALESEIGMLKEEVSSLKQLLGVGEIDT